MSEIFLSLVPPPPGIFKMILIIIFLFLSFRASILYLARRNAKDMPKRSPQVFETWHEKAVSRGPVAGRVTLHRICPTEQMSASAYFSIAPQAQC